ncbi:MAG TPA: TlpA disulfide reductase family protein [Pyrinomonadaceae bacterium]|jgi:thiol-disulfide isomerase/thioredoxin|nr:TlpA disulfide reductase family protein [Pyrinomonadaceae bacterium]
MRICKALLLIVACLLLASLAAPAQKRKYGTAKTTAVKPVVAPIDTDGLKSLVTKQRSGPLLVNFWATFCDPCRDEFPDLVKIDKDYRPQSLEFVTVSLDDVEDIKTGVPKFLEEMKATMPAYLLDVTDPEPAIKLMDPRWSGALPATFLYNEKGEEVFKHYGRVDPAELRAAIEKLVKKGDVQ